MEMPDEIWAGLDTDFGEESEGWWGSEKDDMCDTRYVLPSRWIPVGERLPEFGVYVLVYEKYADPPFIGRLHEKRGWLLDKSYCEVVGDGWLDDNIEQKDVTHWQPLPSPPEEK